MAPSRLIRGDLKIKNFEWERSDVFCDSRFLRPQGQDHRPDPLDLCRLMLKKFPKTGVVLKGMIRTYLFKASYCR